MRTLSLIVGAVWLTVAFLNPPQGYGQSRGEILGGNGTVSERIDALEEDVGQLDTDLDTETTARQEGDRALQNRLDDERGAREAQNDFLLSQIETLEAVSWNSDELGNLFYVDGNVGIGTASGAAEALTVTGNILLTRESDRAIYLGREPDNTTNGRRLTIRAGDAFSSGAKATRGGDLILEAGNGLNLNLRGFGGGDVILRTGANYIKGADNGGDIVFETGSATNAFVERMRIREDGNVGIGTTGPTSKLDVAGKIRAHSFTQTSDAKLKTKIMPLTNVLEKLEKVRGVSFEWNELAQSRGHASGPRMIGVLAQEVEAVFPTLVTSRTVQDDKAVDYGGLTGILLEAVKELKAEQNTQIAGLKAENAAQQRRIATLEGQLQALEQEKDVLSTPSPLPSFGVLGSWPVFGGLFLAGLTLARRWLHRRRLHSPPHPQ